MDKQANGGKSGGGKTPRSFGGAPRNQGRHPGSNATGPRQKSKGASPARPGMHGGRPGARPVTGARAPGHGKGAGGVAPEVLARLAEAGMLRRDVKVHTGEEENQKAARGRKPAPERTRAAAQAPSRPRVTRAARALEMAYEEQRLQKVMAQSGVASRRHSEELIRAGRVKVNGIVVTELGTKVMPGRDVVEVDQRPLGAPEELLYVLLNKPKGYVTTLHDPQGRPKVVDLLGDIGARVYPVGRLDFETEGLLLLTNDGELAHALMHPTSKINKTYIARVRGVPGVEKIAALERGIELDDGMTLPARVKVIDIKGPALCTISIMIHEGRNRQVRRMLAAVGHEVIHLARTTLGPINLKGLEVGQWRYLTPREIGDLRETARLRSASRVAPVAEVPRTVMTGEGLPEKRRPLREGRGAARPAGPKSFGRAPGKEFGRAPGRNAGRPAGGGPVKAIGGAPVKALGGPAKALGGPVKALGAQVRSPGGPGKVMGGPSRPAGGPGKFAGGPAKFVGGPVRSAGNGPVRSFTGGPGRAPARGVGKPSRGPSGEGGRTPDQRSVRLAPRAGQPGRAGVGNLPAR